MKPSDYVMCRTKQPGWERVACDDPVGRRGVWVRESPGVVEVCAGREGDDFYVKLTAGETLTPQALGELAHILTDQAQWLRLRQARDA